MGKILTVNEYDVSVKVVRKWKAAGMTFLSAVSKYDGLFFMWEHLKERFYAVFVRPVEDFLVKASASCIAIDANVLRPVRENTVWFSAEHLALNGRRSEHLLKPHGSHVFVS